MSVSNKYRMNDRLFQQISQYCKCKVTNQPAQAIHHIINRNCKLLRWDVLNAYPISHQAHNNDIEKCNEYNIPKISKIQRDYLNEKKYTDYKSWLILNNYSQKEWEDYHNKILKRVLNILEQGVSLDIIIESTLNSMS